MTILVPKQHRDGSQLGMHGREWSNVLAFKLYSSSSFINGTAEITSGSLGLMVNDHPILISPLNLADSIAAGANSNIVPIRINNLLQASGDYSMGGHRIKNLGLPVDGGDVANKSYIDKAVQGIKWKQSVRAASEEKDTTYTYWQEFQEATWASNGGGGYIQTSFGQPGWIYTSASLGSDETLELRRPKRSRTGSNNYFLNIVSSSAGSNIIWEYDETTTIDHNVAGYMFDDIPDLKIGDRILVKSFNPAGKNGIYVVERTGSSPNPDNDFTKPLLRKSEDFNSGSEISSAAVFVEEGLMNQDLSFVCTSNYSDFIDLPLGSFNVNWSVFGKESVDQITIFRDISQSERFEVTGTLRDINDLLYDYSSGMLSFSDPALPNPVYLAGSAGRVKVPNGAFLVGDGNNWDLEGGNTVRTTLGIGTGSNPIFSNLELTGGALTASHIISNSASPLILSSDISGSVDITGKALNIDSTITTNNISTTTLTANQSISSNTISATNNITAQYVTASVALSASYLQLKEFVDQSDFELNNPSNNSLYVAANALFFDGSPIASSGIIGGQPKENVLFYGGNITSDTANAGDHSPGTYYTRLGVSGSYISPITSQAGRSSHYQILTGSFAELTGSKARLSNVNITSGEAVLSSVDIDGGTIDATNIGQTSAGLGTFTKLVATEITGSAELTNVNIDGGTIDAIDIGQSTPGLGAFTTLSATSVNIDGGTIDATDIGQSTPALGTFTKLVATEITGSAELTNVNIDGGIIDNVTIGVGSTILASTGDFATGSFYTLTASNIISPQSSELSLVKINVTNTGESSYIKQSGGAKLNIISNAISTTELTASILSGSDVDIDGGTIDATTIGQSTAAAGTFTTLTATIFSGSDVDIDGGTIDATTIGQSSAAAGTFSTLTGSRINITDPLNNNIAIITTLTSSNVNIGPGDGNNFGIFNTITSSHIEIASNLTAASSNVDFNFNDNYLKDIKTIDLTESTRNYAVNRDFIDKNISTKLTVKLAAESNIDITNLNAGDTIDNVSLSAGDRILLTSQNTQSENGIYVVPTTATTDTESLRSHDLKTAFSSSGIYVSAINSKSSWLCTNQKNSDVVGTNNLTFVKIASATGTSTAGDGISKDTNGVISVNLVEGSYDDPLYTSRSNLTFNSSDKLILSSSVRLDELKIVNNTNSGKIIISGSSDSAIDNVKIGLNNPVNSNFADVELVNLTTSGNISGAANSDIIFTSGSFDHLVVNNILTAASLPSGENQLKIEETLFIDRVTNVTIKDDRLYNIGGDLYWKNDKIGFGTSNIQKDFTSLFVTGSQSDGHGVFVSGSLIVEGDVQFRGATTTISSSNSVIQDSILGLGITGSNGNESFNNLGERGIIFAKSPNQHDALPGLWWDGSQFNFAKSLTSPSSSSFGSITERSNISAGAINATQITSSLGLALGTGGTSYSLPSSTGTTNQILSVDSSGDLVFVDNSASISSLSLDNITSGSTDNIISSDASLTVSGTNDLNLRSSSGNIILSSSNKIEIRSNGSIFDTDFYSKGTKFFNIEGTDETAGYKNLLIEGNSFHILNSNESNSNSRRIGNTGARGTEIISEINGSNVHGSFAIGTTQNKTNSSHGQNVTGSLIFQSADRRFIFVDTSIRKTSGAIYDYPFFNIQKKKEVLTNVNTEFEVEFNVSKGNSGSYLVNWNNGSAFTHKTFFKADQDGEITKLGQDTPQPDQVATWDGNKVVWEDAPAGFETYNPNQTSAFTAAVGNYYSLNSSGGGFVVSLPQVSTTSAGQKIILKYKLGENDITINPYSIGGTNDTIESHNTFTFSESTSISDLGQSITLVSDGSSNWEII